MAKESNQAIPPKTPAPALGQALARQIVGRDLTRAVTVEQINQNQGAGQPRRYGDVREIDTQNRTVDLAFASEAPVDRWFGSEVLDVSEAGMRAGRISDGAALLLNHDWDRQIGVVESVEIGADHVARATVRFSRSPEGDAVFQDVVDGIRKHVSVGYSVRAIEITKREGQSDLVRVTDWEPYEISIVSVPADTSVGVGRAAPEDAGDELGQSDNQTTITPGSGQGDTRMNIKIMRDAQGNLVRAKVDDSGNIIEVIETLERAGDSDTALRQAGSAAERTRVSALLDLGRTYDALDLAQDAVTNGHTPEQLQARLLERLNQRGNSQRPLSEGDSAVGLSEQEIRNYSIFRGLRALMPTASQADRDAAAFELQCSEAAQRQYGRDARGLMIPQEVLSSRAFNAGGGAATPAGAVTGANIVATDFLAGSFVDMLRNRTVLLNLAQSMTGLVGNVSIPKQTGGASAYWIGEEDNATEGVPTIGQIGMSPKTIAAYTDISRNLLMQSTPSAEGIVRNDLNRALALGIDKAGFYGSGAGDEPKGVTLYPGINAVDFATSGAPTYAELVSMESQIAADNADVQGMAYVLNAAMRGTLKTTQKFAGTNGAPVWEDGNTVNGYRSEVTNQINTGDVLFGNFADLVVGLWGGLDVTIDPYSLSKSGGLRIVMFQSCDFVLRRAESFCLGKKAA